MKRKSAMDDLFADCAVPGVKQAGTYQRLLYGTREVVIDLSNREEEAGSIGCAAITAADQNVVAKSAVKAAGAKDLACLIS
ncbi:MAG: hypothetical protein U0Y08_14950 [Bacteroidia bacterium]